MTDADPPPDSNSRDRSTVATPSLMVRPRNRVPSGIAVYIAGRAPISSSLGPLSSSLMAADPTAGVCGISRSTGARPELSVKLPRKKYTRTVMVPSFGVGSTPGVLTGVAPGVAPGVLPGEVPGVADVPGVGSSLGISRDGCSTGG